MILVFNASPLIVLSKAGLIDSLLPLASEMLVPSPVAEEVARVDDPFDAAKLWLSNHVALVVEPPSVSPFVTAWDLGAGESSVISLVESLPGSVAVLDDLAARRCAQALGLRIMGTLGVLLAAKRAGLIPLVKPALDSVVAAGLFISPHHLNSVLRHAGETE